ncbi:MAG: GNAT family N-acetyltransferase [Armatimonadetes bacterium]|nr:GNAT family N-acetyltransferase [Armatimonadota bacterium]
MFTIRRFRPDDLPRLRELTAICFNGVSIDQNIENRIGAIAGIPWQERKAAHVEDDAAADPDGIFVAERDGEVVGYISGRLNRKWRIGWIANLAVDPCCQKQGIARALFDHVFAYFRENGMLAAKIETLEQNAVGQSFFPALGFEEVARQIHYIKRLE